MRDKQQNLQGRDRQTATLDEPEQSAMRAQEQVVPMPAGEPATITSSALVKVKRKRAPSLE